MIVQVVSTVTVSDTYRAWEIYNWSDWCLLFHLILRGVWLIWFRGVRLVRLWSIWLVSRFLLVRFRSVWLIRFWSTWLVRFRGVWLICWLWWGLVRLVGRWLVGLLSWWFGLIWFLLIRFWLISVWFLGRFLAIWLLWRLITAIGVLTGRFVTLKLAGIIDDIFAIGPAIVVAVDLGGGVVTSELLVSATSNWKWTMNLNFQTKVSYFDKLCWIRCCSFGL